ncbi:hypothetical protein Cantr_05711 [Candida viswanathii]|uniref:RRN6 beta-propeller domain-containing protein n=1 Tax=Candida viswanathii TaxID=5486 RepID=A0A367XRM7_9ASCO|nr:hypothetical protein Cantr_05711 [Candida viswanathii]
MWPHKKGLGVRLSYGSQDTYHPEDKAPKSVSQNYIPQEIILSYLVESKTLTSNIAYDPNCGNVLQMFDMYVRAQDAYVDAMTFVTGEATSVLNIALCEYADEKLVMSSPYQLDSLIPYYKWKLCCAIAAQLHKGHADLELLMVGEVAASTLAGNSFADVRFHNDDSRKIAMADTKGNFGVWKDFVVVGNYGFMLTSKELIWFSFADGMTRLLSWKHFLNDKDPSLKLEISGSEVFTCFVYSQINPCIIVFTLGYATNGRAACETRTFVNKLGNSLIIFELTTDLAIYTRTLAAAGDEDPEATGDGDAQFQALDGALQSQDGGTESQQIEQIQRYAYELGSGFARIGDSQVKLAAPERRAHADAHQRYLPIDKHHLPEGNKESSKVAVAVLMGLALIKCQYESEILQAELDESIAEAPSHVQSLLEQWDEDDHEMADQELTRTEATQATQHDSQMMPSIRLSSQVPVVPTWTQSSQTQTQPQTQSQTQTQTQSQRLPSSRILSSQVGGTVRRKRKRKGGFA